MATRITIAMCLSVAASIAVQSLSSSAASAQERMTAAQCVQQAMNVAQAAGATPLAEPSVEFLIEKDARAHQYTLPQAGCIGFLAIGQGMVKDLDLALHASSGIMLAQDAAQDAHPYVRYCGASGLSVHLIVQMYEGRGEVTVLPFMNAPPELRALNDALQTCGAIAAAPALTDVGPEPVGPALAQSYSLMSARLAQLGYAPDQVLVDDTLAERRRDSREAVLKGDACYAIAAIGDTTVEDIDLRVLTTGAEQAVLGEDTSRERTALIKVCPGDAAIALDIRMYQGQGRYQIHSFVALRAPFAAPPAGTEGPSRIGYGELTHNIARRGMHAVSTTWALAQPGEQLALPVMLSGGRCYAFGAIVGPELNGADLDLRLVDDVGHLLAWELGPSDQPLVFHCPERDRLVHVIGEAHGIRGAGRFLVIVADDSAAVGGKS